MSNGHAKWAKCVLDTWARRCGCWMGLCQSSIAPERWACEIESEFHHRQIIGPSCASPFASLAEHHSHKIFAHVSTRRICQKVKIHMWNNLKRKGHGLSHFHGIKKSKKRSTVGRRPSWPSCEDRCVNGVDKWTAALGSLNEAGCVEQGLSDSNSDPFRPGSETGSLSNISQLPRVAPNWCQSAPEALSSRWDNLDTSHAIRLSPEVFEDKQKINQLLAPSKLTGKTLIGLCVLLLGTAPRHFRWLAEKKGRKWRKGRKGRKGTNKQKGIVACRQYVMTFYVLDICVIWSILILSSVDPTCSAPEQWLHERLLTTESWLKQWVLAMRLCHVEHMCNLVDRAGQCNCETVFGHMIDMIDMINWTTEQLHKKQSVCEATWTAQHLRSISLLWHDFNAPSSIS